MELELNTDTLSLGQRLSRIFTSPSRVFVDLQRNHSWLAALLIISSISLVAALPLLSKMREFSIMQLQRMPDNPALSSPEAINLVGTTAVIGTIAGALLMPLLFALIVALLLKLFNAFTGDKVQYRKLFAVCVYAYLPMLLSCLIALIIGLTTPVESFGNVSTTLYLFFPPDTFTFPAMLAARIDPFMLWSLYLAALGGAILMKSEVKKVGIYVFLIWLIYALGTSYYGALKMSTMV
ncbi:MAG TPA: hypothetical protein DD791_14180 [Syntrophomonas sp.]|jgi:hypothetical protein|nr:hypothetical protein [Syntrophomonas sp.]